MNFFQTFDLNDSFKATMVLFAVIDIIGSIPIILKLKQSSGKINELRTSLVSLGIMIGFLILGENILGLFGVEIASFAVAGSLILFALALEMILGVELFKDQPSGKIASIVPLAFPIIAGAGTMTSIISLRAEFDMVNIIVAIF
ncbi:MAG: multiple antibiotic resistance protein, partial [Lentimonas sp.]